MPYASPLILPQWRVEETLRSLLRRHGVSVDLACELISLEQDDSRVAVTLQSKETTETVQCQYLVAADGGRSTVRKYLKVPFEGETWNEERMYVGDVSLQGLDRDAWHCWPKSAEGWLTLCPLPSTDSFQLQAQAPADHDEEPSLELFQNLVARRTGGMPIELLEATWLSLYRPQVRMVSRMRIERIFLAGDAAHIHSPAGGQGMNTGIQDAYNLGWKLQCVLEGSAPELLETYQEERLPIAASILGISTRLYREMTAARAEVRNDPSTLQLNISYRGASLSQGVGGQTSKLSSGDRAPDAPGTLIGGETVRLFDLFRGPHFTLLRVLPDARNTAIPAHGRLRIVDVLGPDEVASSTSEVDTFVDAYGNARVAYGAARGDLILIRPDGYIGWMGSQSDEHELQNYLDRFTGSSNAR